MGGTFFSGGGGGTSDFLGGKCLRKLGIECGKEGHTTHFRVTWRIFVVGRGHLGIKVHGRCLRLRGKRGTAGFKMEGLRLTVYVLRLMKE